MTGSTSNMAPAESAQQRRLAGKVAIVSGAAYNPQGTGTGAAVATLFAQQGARVLIVNRTQDSAQQLCAQIETEGGICEYFHGDMTDEADITRLARHVQQQYGQLDILFNNVGSGAPGTTVNVTRETWDHALSQNLTSAMLTSKYCIPLMQQNQSGSIINVSTVGAAQGFKRDDVGFAAYSAAKAGLIGLTLSTAADFAHQGIRANCLLVGMINTPALQKFGEQAREQRRLAVPLQTEGSAWDAAWAAVFLASDESRWITGASLPVDGGQMNLRRWPG